MYPFWVICQYIDINRAEIVRIFKIHFKMKSIHDSDIPTGLAVSQIVYLPSLSIISLTFETFALSVTITCWRFCFIIDGHCAHQKFLSSSTSCPIRYLVRSLHFPPKFSKNVHLYWMTEFSANFYIRSNFFNILNRFQTIFTSEVNDRPIWNDSEKHNTWS